ncbi:MAG: bifunctional metallophosphatase/5'-nucleotidase [Gemmatimonadota bacterium]
MKRFPVLAVVALLFFACNNDPVAPPPQSDGITVLNPSAKDDQVHFWLTLLHNNDGESQLIDAGSGLEDFGGVARFASLVDELKQEAKRRPREAEIILAGLTPAGDKGGPPPSTNNPGSSAILVSSGDNFLAGPEFNLSIQKGVPYFDAIALDRIGYDALAIGNHEFDFGPDVLEEFILSFLFTDPPFLSSNLDFSLEPGLLGLVGAGRIAESTVVQKRGQQIGIIGATTPALPFISSPRDVIVLAGVAGEIQFEVDKLEAQGVDKIILISHLQDVDEDLALVPQLDGVDIVVAGGGDELLANAGDLLIPGDAALVSGPYPLIAFDMDGTLVPVVTTSGGYRYVGRLVAGFNKDGELIAIHDASGPVRVAGGANSDAVPPDPVVQSQVVDPVIAGLAALASNVIATSQVDLDGLRSSVRFLETNEGNLVADALLWQAQQLAGGFGVDTPVVALQNGGGIRNDAIIPAGPFTELNTFDILPFPNFVSVVENIPRSQFKEILENAVSEAAPGDIGGSGRFAQIAGFSFEWDPTGTAQMLDADANVVVPGTRVVNATLEGGETVVTGGLIVPGDDIDVATIDFLARGGDQYPFRGAPFATLGVTYQQALFNYIVDELAGLISSADYPEGGEGRIVEL